MLEQILNAPNFDYLSRGLEAANMRHEVISNNIANVNTPNFKRSAVNFEDLLAKELNIGDNVSIIDGPFKGMTGKVENIDLENNRLNIIIDLFGQETNVDVEVYQVSKL